MSVPHAVPLRDDITLIDGNYHRIIDNTGSGLFFDYELVQAGPLPALAWAVSQSNYFGCFSTDEEDFECPF